MKKASLLLALFAGLLLLAGTSCNKATGSGCLHIDSNIETINEKDGSSLCALCNPENDLHNELEQKFAWSKLD